MDTLIKSTMYIGLLLDILPSALAIVEWDPTHNTCGSGPGGPAILSEVAQMGSAALGFMNNLQQNQQSNPWDYYRTATIFDTIFDSRASDAASRWSTVQSNLGTMANLVSSSPNVYVTCDDTTLWTVSPSSSVGAATTFRNPVDNQNYDYPNGFTTCKDPVNGQYQLGYRVNVGGTEFISLCLANNHPTELLSQQTYSEGQSITDITTLSTTFFHEMCHVALPNRK